METSKTSATPKRSRKRVLALRVTTSVKAGLGNNKYLKNALTGETQSD